MAVLNIVVIRIEPLQQRTVADPEGFFHQVFTSPADASLGTNLIRWSLGNPGGRKNANYIALKVISLHNLATAKSFYIREYVDGAVGGFVAHILTVLDGTVAVAGPDRELPYLPPRLVRETTGAATIPVLDVVGSNTAGADITCAITGFVWNLDSWRAPGGVKLPWVLT